MGTNAITDIFLSDPGLSTEIFGIVYDPSQGLFLVSNINEDFLSITTAGVVTDIGNTNTFLRGLAFFEATEATVPEPGTLALFGIGLVGLGVMRSRRKAA